MNPLAVFRNLDPSLVLEGVLHLITKLRGVRPVVFPLVVETHSRNPNVVLDEIQHLDEKGTPD
jgi:hypothetical protein